MSEIKHYKRDAAFAQLKQFDFLAKEDDFIEVTLWHNGEGFDACTADQHFELTWGQFKALKKLIKELDK